MHNTKADALAAEHNGHNQKVTVSGKTPDEWIQYTQFLVSEGLEDARKGINSLHILQEFILMGVLVEKDILQKRLMKPLNHGRELEYQNCFKKVKTYKQLSSRQ